MPAQLETLQMEELGFTTTVTRCAVQCGRCRRHVGWHYSGLHDGITLQRIGIMFPTKEA